MPNLKTSDTFDMIRELAQAILTGRVAPGGPEPPRVTEYKLDTPVEFRDGEVKQVTATLKVPAR